MNSDSYSTRGEVLICIGFVGNCYKTLKIKIVKKARQDIGILAFSYKYYTSYLLLHHHPCNLLYKRLHHFTRKVWGYFTSGRYPPDSKTPLVVLSHPHFHLPTDNNPTPNPTDTASATLLTLLTSCHQKHACQNGASD